VIISNQKKTHTKLSMPKRSCQTFRLGSNLSRLFWNWKNPRWIPCSIV